MGEKQPDAAELLAKHEVRNESRCLTCRDPYKSLLNGLLDKAVATQQRVTVTQLWNCVRDATDYPQAESSLQKHLSKHDVARYRRLNLSHRGPLE